LSKAHMIACVVLYLCSTAVVISQKAPDSSPLLQNSSQASSLDLSSFTRIFGSEDREVPLPSSGGFDNRKDVSALQEIIDYLNTVKVSTWNGMKAEGIFEDSNDVSGNAALTLGRTDQYRLDITLPNGTRSTRIDGYVGSTLQEDGKKLSWSAASAVGGIVAFPRLFATTLGYTATAIVDRGFVTIGQTRLHRISILEPASADSSVAEHGEMTVTDFYFDAKTHLLKMSAATPQVTSSDAERYLVVATYDDYSQVGQMLLPFKVSRTMNGQRQWSLQLTNANLAPATDSSYFTF